MSPRGAGAPRRRAAVAAMAVLVFVAPARVASAQPTEQPGLFTRATSDQPLERLTFLSPGLTWVAWQPVKVEEPARTAASGVGLELSLTRWIARGAYLGAVTQVERLSWTRATLGLEAGYQLVGLEVALAREFGTDDTRAQWSLQIAPYASLGMVYVAPRWILALDRRSARDTLGDGAMLVLGLKIPVRIAGGRGP